MNSWLTTTKRARETGLRWGWPRGASLASCCALVAACSPSPSDAGASGGGSGVGGLTAAGGLSGSGGSGHASSGGASAGSSGGVEAGTGGANTGGTEAGTGGVPSGGTGAGSASGGSTNFEPAFILGADISGAQESTASYVDTDGQTKTLFGVLQNHGFNYVRLRTFVDPGAPGGYASSADGCAGKSEEFGDKAHVIEYGKLAKDAGMGFLLDFHYSDVWADPGNQIIPESWRSATTTDELAALLKAYTKDVVESAIAAGARPDLVQVGNEITPGMVAHLPGPDTDCWGNNPGGASPIGGSNSSTAAWDRLAVLLQAGIEGVREVDPTIKVMLHVENTDDLSGVEWWVESAVTRGVDFDVLGLSCYTQFQGPPSTWENTFETMAAEYPELEFVIAEYNPERTAANMLMKNLPDGRGLGTFFWEPTLSGEWGDSMFSWDGSAQVAIPSAFQEYDDMLGDLGL